MNLQTRLPKSHSVLVQLIRLISEKNNQTFTYPRQTKLPLEDLKCNLSFAFQIILNVCIILTIKWKV